MDNDLNDIHFAFEGADHPAGPYAHLLVVEMDGVEAFSEPYEFRLELVRPSDGVDVDPYYLVGAACTLRIRTKTTPAVRLIHGVIISAEQYGDVEDGARYTIKVGTPLAQASMMKKSVIHLEKTLREIIDMTLTRTSLGAGLTLSQCPQEEIDEDLPTSFSPATPTYVWRTAHSDRLDDAEARPYCVQYQESDLAFVSRLLEEEGIAYHFEHTPTECRLVLSDYDDGRTRLEGGALAPAVIGRELVRFTMKAALLPRSVCMDDYNWQKPELELMALSGSGVSYFTTVEYPGRYEASPDTGKVLAQRREERLDSERRPATGITRCRALGAGMIIELDHPLDKFRGEYLVNRVRHRAHQRGNFGANHGERSYENSFECLRRGWLERPDESGYRPALRTYRPRIYGSQTAFVTADPSAQEAEINVGGPSDLGCVRVRFHWDMDSGRHAVEPTSCWVRVSQLFAGGSHGALWHPRVGNEVIVEFIDADPDRPIITGRVFNAVNIAPQNATQSPTISEIRSHTSPDDGTFNSILFDDAAGQQEISIHASRDMNTSVVRNSSRTVGNDESISVTGSQSTSAGAVSISSGSNVDVSAKDNISETAGVNYTAHAGTNYAASAGAKMDLSAPIINVTAGGNLNASAPWIDIAGGPKIRAGATLVEVNGGSFVNVGAGNSVSLSAPWIDIKGGAKTRVGASLVEVNGATIIMNGGEVSIKGSGTVNIEGGTVNIKGGTINLNC